MPGIANTASMTTVAPSMRLTSRPSTVSRFTLTFFRPCFHRMASGDRPLACKVRTNCEDSTSTKAERNWRVTSAMPPAASAMAGKVAWCIASNQLLDTDTDPVAGNSPMPSDKVATRISASQKLGSATPSELIEVIAASSLPPERVAARMPKGTPMAIDSSNAITTTISVFGKRCAIIDETCSLDCSDLPRSNCSAPDSQLQYCTNSGRSKP